MEAKSVFVIAQDELIIDNGEESQVTRICQNFGAFTTKEKADKKALSLNNEVSGESVEDEPEYWVYELKINE